MERDWSDGAFFMMKWDVSSFALLTVVSFSAFFTMNSLFTLLTFISLSTPFTLNSLSTLISFPALTKNPFNEGNATPHHTSHHPLSTTIVFTDSLQPSIEKVVSRGFSFTSIASSPAPAQSVKRTSFS